MNKNSGFTLIEILIAALVLAVGLLGLAGLQAASIKNNLSAYNRSQATQLAYDMADRMRANKNESLDPASGSVIAASTYLTIAPTSAAAQASCETVTGCTRAQMAQNDLFQWNAALAGTLPSGTGTITVVAATRVFTITVSWKDNPDGSNTSFLVSFQL
ncbi:type IV pilus modification protein PilV [Candidatus Methylobacter oryzae]|uniref:Type IV pilus modification protein PilV n=1 Tax=Candidatus Methylobacter oryzae TaxID=2497749 RepID=A0ABY3C883_9GAMM|nr:type IV pilus modification protein PilV [Candidatus Methylobacter oryzae]TRW92786.1 type IV pilus modification protein PilV [Candidatus Methylobacter oryzae]